MSAANQRFLKPHLLARLAGMELRARTVVEGFMAGIHRSPYRGLSLEFAEYRQYQPGDDPRRLDWKAYARSDRYYVREYEDESNLSAWIVLDASASMGFGSGALSKWQYGGILAASLACLFERQKDNVGLVILDEKIRVELPPGGSRNHLTQLIGQMERTVPARGTRLAPVLHHVAGGLRRKGMVLVISDLLDEPGEVVDALRHLQFGGSDVLVFQTLDPAELGFDFTGPSLFVDPETQGVVPALAEEVRAGYLEAMGNFVHAYAEQLGRINIQHTVVNTGRPLDEALLAFLMGQRRRQ